jgi:hypothetical protein
MYHRVVLEYYIAHQMYRFYLHLPSWNKLLRRQHQMLASLRW